MLKNISSRRKWKFTHFWQVAVIGIILFLQFSGSAFSQEKVPVDILEVTAAIPREFPPQYDVDESGKPVGFAIDVMEQIAVLAGLKVTYLVEDTWSIVADALQSGRADLIPNLGITPERQVEFVFTTPIETFPVSIFVREQTSDITGLADLNGRKVGAVKYNVAVSLLQEQSGVQLKVFDHPPEALFELLAGNVDAFVYPRPVLLKMAQDINVSGRIKTVGTPLIEVKRAIAVRKDNTELLQRLERAVNSFVGTTDYQRIYVKWYGEPKPFWTVSKVALLMGAIFLLGFAAMVVWRYQTMARLNRQLIDTIGGRKQVEKALRESREVLLAVFDATHDSVILLDSEGIIQAINTTAARRFNTSPKELVGLDMYSLLTPNLATSRKKKLQETTRTKEPVSFTDERAGRTYDNTIYPVLDSEGNASRFAIFAQDITERKRAEDDLQKTTSILHAIFEGAIDGLYAKDLKGHYLRINSAGAQLFGKPVEQIIGKDDRALFLSKGARRTMEFDRKVITTGEILTIEETLTATNGVTRTYLTTKSPYRDEHGEIIGLLGISRDITKRKQAEEALRKNEAQLKRTQQIARIGYWKRNFQTGEAEWSDEQYRLFGYDPGEVQPTFELLRSHVHPEDLDLLTNSVMDALNYGKTIDVEYRFFRKNGEVRFAHSQGEVGSDETGTWIHGTLHDITERKRAEEGLRKSEEQYRLIIDNASEGIFVAQDGLLRFLNSRVEEIWGYSREELLSLSFLDFIHHEDRDVVTNTYFNTLRSGDVLSRNSFRIITQDGSVKWVEVSGVLIEWEGKPATLNFVTDITKRKRAEEQIKASLLEKEVFLQEAYHRSRNTIQMICGLLTLQSAYIEDEGTGQIFEEAQNRIRAIGLVQEKLYQSRDISHVDLKKYLEDLSNTVLMNYRVSPDRILLKLDIEDVVLSVHTAVPCGMILHELLSNALKHAFPDDRTGEIVITLRPTEGKGIELRVSDDGIGLPKDVEFENPSSLGLQLITNLAENQLQGTIELQNRDKGTEVLITFKEPRHKKKERM